MFLVLVCLFVMTSPYKTALKTCIHTTSSSIPDAYACKYSLKNVIRLSGALSGNVSRLVSVI